MQYHFDPLILGDLEIPIPILQGGMGVKVSTAPLAAAVSQCGAAGTIASVALGFDEPGADPDYVKSSCKGLTDQLHLAHKLTDKPVGVNILTAVSNYEQLARTSAAEGAHFVVSGAGLPLKLPQYIEDRHVRLIPIVSSPRAAELILRTWVKRYDRYPDAFIVEGPMAGGHLGFAPEDLCPHGDKGRGTLESIVRDVLRVARDNPLPNGRPMPVIAAGGVFDGRDMARFLRLGASGVQMASRFVTTNECTVPDSFKQLYVNCTADDLAIIPSPVGMPGRVIETEFTRRMLRGERVAFKCHYRCLKSCNPATAPFCIAKALKNAITGDLDNAVVFAGSNVPRITRIMPVAELIDEVASEASRCMAMSV